MMDESVTGEVNLPEVFIIDDEVGIVCSDNAPELESATSKFTVRHNTSRPYVDQTKAVVEREIRTVLEGTRSNLCQAGLPDKLWPLAAQHHAMALNLTKSTENVTGASKFAGKGEDGIFLEYHIQPGFIWRHEYVVAPKLDDQECVFPPIRTRVCLERPCTLGPEWHRFGRRDRKA